MNSFIYVDDGSTDRVVSRRAIELTPDLALQLQYSREARQAACDHSQHGVEHRVAFADVDGVIAMSNGDPSGATDEGWFCHGCGAILEAAGG